MKDDEEIVSPVMKKMKTLTAKKNIVYQTQSSDFFQSNVFQIKNLDSKEEQKKLNLEKSREVEHPLCSDAEELNKPEKENSINTQLGELIKDELTLFEIIIFSLPAFTKLAALMLFK